MTDPTPTPTDVLRRARELLSEPQAWIQGDYAADATGHRGIEPENPAAVCFCLSGALFRASGEVMKIRPIEFNELASERLNRAVKSAGWPGGYITFNDEPGRTHEEILEVLDTAIALG